jgi:hypothetical protein
MKKLICIDDSIKLGQEHVVANLYQNWVRKGSKYTVRRYLNNNGIVDGLLLNEIINEPVYQPLLNDIQEPAFRIDRFVESHDDSEVAVEELDFSIIKI